jgi:hypothetical protein
LCHFQEADAVRPDNVHQKINLKQQSNTVAASNLHVVYVAQENQQLQPLQLVPISVPALQLSQQQEPPVKETVNFQLELKNKLATAKDSKTTKTTVAQPLAK